MMCEPAVLFVSTTKSGRLSNGLTIGLDPLICGPKRGVVGTS